MNVKIKVKGKEFKVRQLDFHRQEVRYADKDGKWYHSLFSEVEMFVMIGKDWVKIQ